jgi:hypothetical protein
MPKLYKALKLVIDAAEDKLDPPVETELDRDDVEMLKQILDRVALCQHGDGTFLEVDVRYEFRNVEDKI